MIRSLETRVFQGYWEDGALDLVAGVAVVLIGLTYVFEQLFLVGTILPLALVAWWGLRRRVVEPRAGYVRFSRARRERSQRELIGTIGIGGGLLVLVAIGALRLMDGRPAQLTVGLPASLLAVGSALVSGLTRSWRFTGYAVLLGIAAAATVVLGTDPGWPIVVAGLVTSASGAVLFARFTAASRRFEKAKG